MKFYSHNDWGGGGTVSHLLIKSAGMQEVKLPQDADIIVFNGGEDIATSIYGERPIMRGIPETPTIRDKTEIALFDLFSKDKSKLILGVCRGAQLLNCLNGGTLYQHVNNHTRNHDMLVKKTGIIMRVTSTHHQQMRAGPGGEVLAIASESDLKIYDDGGAVQLFPKPDRELLKTHPEELDEIDTEIVWYPATNTLCIQGHPEYVPGTIFADYCLDLINSKVPELVAA